jgi:hypothetical protein
MALIESGIGSIPVGRWTASQKSREELWRCAAIESEKQRARLGLPPTTTADPELEAAYCRTFENPTCGVIAPPAPVVEPDAPEPEEELEPEPKPRRLTRRRAEQQAWREVRERRGDG